MPLLRFAYVLALALWLGGMLVLGAVVAPSLFSTLATADPETGRALAGVAFGAVLARFHHVAYVAGGVLLVTLTAMALLGPRPRSFAVRTAIVGIMLGVAVYSGVMVLGEIEGIRRQVTVMTPAPDPKPGTPGTSPSPAATRRPELRLPSSLPQDHPLRVRFDQLHALSTRLMMFNILGGLVLLVWEASEPSR